MGKEWTRTTRYLVAVGLTCLGVFLLYISRSIFPLIALAALLALLVRPVAKFFNHRLRIPWRAAVIITHLLATIIILLAPLVLLPPIINGVRYLLELDYQALIQNTLQWLETTLIEYKQKDLQILGYAIILDSMIDPILASLQNVSPGITLQLPSLNVILNSITQAFAISYGLAVNVVGMVVSIIVSFLFLIIFSIYFNIDAQRFYRQVLNFVSPAYREDAALLIGRLTIIWGSFFRGELLLMLTIFLLTWIGNTALGLPGAFTLAVIAGFLEVIPNIGPTIALIPATLVALIQGSTYLDISHFWFALLVIGFYILIQMTESYLLVPRVMGVAIRLHPLVVMSGILIGASVAGVLGILLAAPVIASGNELFRYLYRKMMGQEPFPAEEEVRITQKPTLRESYLKLKADLKQMQSRLKRKDHPKPPLTD